MRIAARGKSRRSWWSWLLLSALGICAFVWWDRGGTLPNWAQRSLQGKAPIAERSEYRLAGGYPAAASLDVFRRLSALSQADNNQALQKLKEQGLVGETTEGQKVQVLTRRGSFREVQVQEVGTGKTYWTYVEALEK
jgi:hypothetical protein